MTLARGVLCVLVMSSPTLARADGRPWATGVTEGAQATAKQLLAEGTTLYLDGRYTEALETYRKALAHWDHPAIHFDIVECLIQLERPVEAADELERAIAYGKDALPEGKYGEALAYRKLLTKQVGELTIRCREAGATVSVDGKALGSCPVERTRKVESGEHQVVAAKPGYLTETQNVLVVGGRRVAAEVILTSLDHAGVQVRRWPVAVPWLVLGGAALIGGVGGLVQLKSAGDRDSYEAEEHLCAAPCDRKELDPRLDARFHQENYVAIGLFVVAGAAAVTGGTLLYLNRAHTIYPTVSSSTVGIAGAF